MQEFRSEELLDREVRSSDGDKLSRVHDVTLEAGRPQRPGSVTSPAAMQVTRTVAGTTGARR